MPLTMLLKCHDVKITQSFYKDILDFEIIDSNEQTCTVRKEDCTIVFTSEELWSGHPKCTGTLYFHIKDVETYYEAIKEKAIIVWPLQEMPYGIKEFGVKDYDEYHIAFAQKK